MMTKIKPTQPNIELAVRKMRERGISYSNLSDLTGIPHSSLQRHLTGNSKAILTDEWNLICAVLGIGDEETSNTETRPIVLTVPANRDVRDRAKLNGVVRISEDAELALLELCGKTGLSMRSVASQLIVQAARITDIVREEVSE